MKLVVGLTHLSSAWEQAFCQEGVSHSLVDYGKHRLDEEYSVIAVTAAPDPERTRVLEEYLRSGGAVLGYAGHLGAVCRSKVRAEHLEYLVADGNGLDITLLDIDGAGVVPRDANMLRTSSGTSALYLGPLKGGFAALLPFDLSASLYDTRPATRQFYAKRERLPFERVSRVAKGEAMHLVHRVLERLHAFRGVPYIRLAHFPHGENSACMVRVDTDGATRSEVDELRALAQKHRLRLSWFLDVKGHQQWLDHFGSMDGDELGVHCYEHHTYKVYEQNLRSIRRARDLMVSAGLHPEGFSAPYGLWNSALAAAIDEIGFLYSSEFSYAYDALPLYPVTSVRQFSALQIPVHPICFGSLKRVGYTEPQMQEYMAMVIERKLFRGEPLFFYHHPRDRFVRALDFLFSAVKERTDRNVTMAEFARWWKKRLQMRFEADYDADTHIAIRSLGTPDDAHGDLFLEITRPDGFHTRIPFQERVSLPGASWDGPVIPHGIPDDFRRIREFDLRTTIADLYASVMRSVR